MRTQNNSISVLLVLLGLLSISYAQYTLNGKQTDYCPFYTQLNTNTQNCDQLYYDPGEQFNVLSEFWYKKSVALTDMDTNWVLGNPDSGTVVTPCGAVQVYGGYGAIKNYNGKVKKLTASYSNLAAHKNIHLNFKFYFIDTWDSETVTVTVDGVKIETYAHHVSLSPANECGQNDKDFIRNFHYEIVHTAPTLSITIEWALDQGSTDESGGIREISVASTIKPLYLLNGKYTDKCPFYAPLDKKTNTCVDPFYTSTQTSSYFLLDETLYQKQFDYSSFKSSNWVSGNTGADDQFTSICGAISVYGGYNKIQSANGARKFIRTQYYGLDPHNSIQLRFQFWYLDSWDNEQLRVTANGAEVLAKKYTVNSIGKTNVCGNPNYADYAENYDITIPHTIDYLDLVIEWNLDESSPNESGGLREIQLSSLLNPNVYLLNGQKTDRCPWYTVADEKAKTCVDALKNSYVVPLLLDETLFRKDFSVYNLDKASNFKRQFDDSKDNYVSQCGGLSVLGGFGALSNTGTRAKGLVANYQNLEPHELFNLRFSFYFIDSWDNDDLFQIYVDGTLYQTIKKSYTSAVATCGNSKWAEQIQNFNFEIPHNSRNLEIKIVWSLDEGTDNESGGIRDLQVLAKGIPPIDLNGKNTDICPFYTVFDANSRVCVDGFVKSLKNPYILSETLFKRQLSYQDATAQGWASVPVDKSNNYVSTCGDVEVYGGYEVLSNTGVKRKTFEATFTDIKPHYQLSIKFKFFYIDSWDKEVFKILVDGVEVKSVTYAIDKNLPKITNCGSTGYSDKIELQVLNVPHNASTAKITIFWDLDQATDDESGALRELQVVASGCAQPRCIRCSSEDVCLEQLPEPVVVPEVVNQQKQDSNSQISTSNSNPTSTHDQDWPETLSSATGSGDQTQNQNTGSSDQTQNQNTGSSDQTQDQNIGSGDQTQNQNIGSGDQTQEQNTGSSDQTQNQTTGSGDQTQDQNTGSGDQTQDQNTGSGDQTQDQKTGSSDDLADSGEGFEEGFSTQSSGSQDQIYEQYGGYQVGLPNPYTGLEDQEQGQGTGSQGQVEDSAGDSFQQQSEGDLTSGESSQGDLSAPNEQGDQSGSVEDSLPSDPSQFDQSYYENNQQQFVDPLSSAEPLNIPTSTPAVQTESTPVELDVEEEDVDLGDSTIDLDQLKKEQDQQEAAEQECVILYSECYYQGEKQTFCDDSPYMIKSIKSIYIPDDIKRIQLFESAEYQGKKSEFTESQDCLEEINYEFLIKSQIKIMKSSPKSHLRKNGKSQKTSNKL